jgi:RNase P subunit RPR2
MVVSMTLEELEKMAQQTAAFGVHPSNEYIYSFYTEQLQAFARLVAQHEREACAKVCDEFLPLGNKCAYAIRARGQA